MKTLVAVCLLALLSACSDTGDGALRRAAYATDVITP